MTPKRTVPAGPRVAVIGAGSWGTTFGKILADGGAHVTMWARRAELAHEIDGLIRRAAALGVSAETLARVFRALMSAPTTATTTTEGSDPR